MRALVLALLLAWGSCAMAQTPGPVLEKARQSTFRVEAARCQDGGGRKATGFLWSDGSTVVTALHVVAGCNTLSVYSEVLKRNITAKLTHTLNAADLAMLHLDGPAGSGQPLVVSTLKPAVHDELTVLGYPLLIPDMNSTELKVKFGGSHLRDIVPDNTLQELAARNSPSPDLEITSLEGFLAPGASGAPIMDKAGHVVAIGDGGLENGTIGMSWGIPATNLNALAQSHETPSAKSSDAHLFAAETEVHATGPTIACGSGSFVKVRTLPYSEILHSTDDAEGLARLLTFFASYGVDTSNLSYDIYQDAVSGGALAVPEGKILDGGRVGCAVKVLPNLTMYIQMAHLDQVSDIQPISLAFERTFTPIPPWYPDPNFTYLQPRQRADGLMVRRKVLLHYTQYAYGNVGWDQGATYETLAAKGQWFIGTTALDRVYSSKTLQVAQGCAMNPRYPGCSDFKQQIQTLVQAVIAAHLTTFPNN